MKKSIYILGIYTGHCATASLLKDGEIIACVSEERFNGIKNYLGFPHKSIEWCLQYARISASDLTAVAIPSSFGAPQYASENARKNAFIFLLSFSYKLVFYFRKGWGLFVYNFPKARPIGTYSYSFLSKTIGSYVLKKEKAAIAKTLGISEDKIISTGHHLSHAAAGYYSSTFHEKKALVFTLDGEGDNLCATISIFEKNKIKKLAETTRENSLGWIYQHVTSYLGMKPMEHEYKVMGLAPYAKERDVLKLFAKIKNIVILDPKNKLRFYSKFNTQDTYRFLKKEMEKKRFDNIAGAFQKLVEDRIVEWIEYAISKTKIRTIVCSGGVFMNVKANQKVLSLPAVKEAFFMPSGGDESLVIGACFLAYHKIANKKNNTISKQLTNLYFGPAFTNDEIKDYLVKNKFDKKYKVRKYDEIETKIAELLSKGKVVARLSGRMEWGARSLGNRAILANPQDRDVVMIINEQMKDRDFWMPFAPSILPERAKDYINIPKSIDASFMIVSFDSTELGRKQLQAAIHPYDFTMRPQVINKAENPSYYKVVKEFEKLTGIGGVLNTSFNLHGLPIVLGPKEAMYAFENSGIEYLAMENYLVSKHE